MRYIDKTEQEGKQKAYTLLKRFIDEQWQDDANCYINLTYKDFSNNELCDLLLKEQQYYCCYCMRHILNPETTIEHIIPNNAKEIKSYDLYSSYGRIGETVFFWEKDLRETKITRMPPFPHILAYENLVASCNGFIPENGYGKCCNNKRGSDDIIPVFYLHSVFEYDPDGRIDCDILYENTITSLGLDQDTLTLFRRCWLNLPSSYNPLDVINAIADEDLRDQIIDDMTFEFISIDDRLTITAEVYWKSFANYFWFYSYKLSRGY